MLNGAAFMYPTIGCTTCSMIVRYAGAASSVVIFDKAAGVARP